MGGRPKIRSWVEADYVDAAPVETSVERDPWDPPALSTGSADSSLPERPSHESDDMAPDAEAGSAWDFIEELADVNPGDQWSAGAFDFPSNWVEPDPTIDASSELSESLYPPDETITDLSRELRIGELLARIEPITEGEALPACSRRRRHPGGSAAVPELGTMRSVSVNWCFEASSTQRSVVSGTNSRMPARQRSSPNDRRSRSWRVPIC